MYLDFLVQCAGLDITNYGKHKTGTELFSQSLKPTVQQP